MQAPGVRLPQRRFRVPVLGDVEDSGQVAKASAALVHHGVERQHAPQGGAIIAAQPALGAKGRRAVGLAVQVAGDDVENLGLGQKMQQLCTFGLGRI